MYYTNRRSGVIHRDERCGYLERSDLTNPTAWARDETLPAGVPTGPYDPGEILDERCQQCFASTWRPPRALR